MKTVVEVKEVYEFSNTTLLGCYVVEGCLKLDMLFDVNRKGSILFPAVCVKNIKRFKENVAKVEAGDECAISIDTFPIIEGDILFSTNKK